MSDPATGKKSSRKVLFSSKNTLESASQGATPTQVAYNLIEKCLESLHPEIQANLSLLAPKLFKQFVAIRYKGKQLRKLENDTDYFPQSIRFKFDLQTPTAFGETPEFLALQADVRSILLECKTQLKSKIAKLCQHELDSLYEQLQTDMIWFGYIVLRSNIIATNRFRHIATNTIHNVLFQLFKNNPDLLTHGNFDIRDLQKIYEEVFTVKLSIPHETVASLPEGVTLDDLEQASSQDSEIPNDNSTPNSSNLFAQFAAPNSALNTKKRSANSDPKLAAKRTKRVNFTQDHNQSSSNTLMELLGQSSQATADSTVINGSDDDYDKADLELVVNQTLHILQTVLVTAYDSYLATAEKHQIALNLRELSNMFNKETATSSASNILEKEPTADLKLLKELLVKEVKKVTAPLHNKIQSLTDRTSKNQKAKNSPARGQKGASLKKKNSSKVAVKAQQPAVKKGKDKAVVKSNDTGSKKTKKDQKQPAKSSNKKKKNSGKKKSNKSKK